MYLLMKRWKIDREDREFDQFIGHPDIHAEHDKMLEEFQPPSSNNLSVTLQ